jgi:hypothetical protein
MSEIETPHRIHPVPVEQPAENGAAASPVLEVLRQRRAERSAERTFDLDVPGYGGLLVLRCGPITGQTLSRLRERLERSRSPERDLNLNADVLIAACRSVLARAKPEDELVELEDDDGPVRLDSRLAAMFEMPASSARQVVVGVYSLANVPELAVATAASDYMEWASSAASEVEASMLGESEAGRP